MKFTRLYANLEIWLGAWLAMVSGANMILFAYYVMVNQWLAALMYAGFASFWGYLSYSELRKCRKKVE